MDQRTASRKLSPLGYKATVLLLLLSSGTSLMAQTAQTPQSTFEVATVRPAAPGADPRTGEWSFPGVGKFNASHISLALLIRLAYDIDDIQIGNKPGWLEDNLYDVAAKPEDGIKLSREELRPRLQALLQQRFHLVVHTETRASPGYALVIDKGGPRLTPTKAEHFPGWRTNVSPGQMRGANWTMPQLAKFLTEASGFPVDDETAIAGSYDIDFVYNPNPDPNPDTDSQLPPLPDALKAATGLVLKPKKIPVKTIVIDSVDKIPIEN